MTILKELFSVLNEKKVDDEKYFVTVGKGKKFDLYTERSFASFDAAQNFITREMKSCDDTDDGDAGREELEQAEIMSGKELKKSYPKLFEGRSVNEGLDRAWKKIGDNEGEKHYKHKTLGHEIKIGKMYTAHAQSNGPAIKTNYQDLSYKKAGQDKWTNWGEVKYGVSDSTVRRALDLKEAQNHMGETEYSSYKSWKAAVKKAAGQAAVSFTGDEDIDEAQVKDDKGTMRSIGEWDGAVGCIYKKPAGLKLEATEKLTAEKAEKEGNTWIVSFTHCPGATDKRDFTIRAVKAITSAQAVAAATAKLPKDIQDCAKVASVKMTDKEKVSEGGIIKTMKRAIAGWNKPGSFGDASIGGDESPAGLVKKNKGYDEKTLNLLKGKPGESPVKGSPRALQIKTIDRELKKRQVTEARSIPAWFKDGAKVKLMPEYADKDPNEVFTLKSVDTETGKGRIADDQGKGWGISYYQVYPKNKTPAIHEAFDDKKAFKRAEMEFELGHEDREEKNRTFDYVMYGVEIDGRLWKKDGEPVSFKSKATAEKSAATIAARGKKTKVVPLKENADLQSLGKTLKTGGSTPAAEPDAEIEDPTAVDTPPADKVEIDDAAAAEAPVFKEGDKVKPLTGPHAGEVHTVVKVLANGSLDIVPDESTNVKYAKGGANARPEQVQLAEGMKLLGLFKKGSLLVNVDTALIEAKKKKTIDDLRAERKEVMDKMDRIVQSGGRIMQNDPLMVRAMALRSEITKMKNAVQEGRDDTMMPLSYRPAKGHKIEAYGRKGMKNTMWRKYFKDSDAMAKWCEDNDATVEGSRDLEKDELR